MSSGAGAAPKQAGSETLCLTSILYDFFQKYAVTKPLLFNCTEILQSLDLGKRSIDSFCTVRRFFLCVQYEEISNLYV